MFKSLSIDPYQNLSSLRNVIMVQLQLLANSLQDRVYKGRSSSLIWNLNQMFFWTDDAEYLIRYYGQAFNLFFSDRPSYIIYLLLCDSLGVQDIEAVQVDNLVNIVKVIDLVKCLPSDVVVNLLKHLSKLIIGYKTSVVLVHVGLVLLIGLLLKVLTDFLKLLINHSIFLSELFLRNLISVSNCAIMEMLLGARVSALNVGVSFDNGYCPKSDRSLRYSHDFGWSRCYFFRELRRWHL